MIAEYKVLFDNPLFRSVMDAIEDVVMAIDKETRIVFVNKAYEKAFNVRQDMILGKKLSEIEGDTTAIRVLKEGKAIVHEQEFLRSAKIDSVGVSFPLKAHGEIVGGISIFNNTARYMELAAKLQRSKELNRFLQEQLDAEPVRQCSKEFITVNGRMKQVLGMAVRVAKSGATVLIRGESGVGKEVMARIIHNNSPKSEGPFIRVNCAAIPDNLLESELFGYESGAFTGAKKTGKPGKFELAQNGTIFLDEIGDMDMSMQVKLLRVLQEKEVERIGATKPTKLDVRIVAATNQNLEEMIKEGQFRQDLYYRLNVIEVMIPPLRDRQDDIPVLAHYFIRKQSDEELYVSPEVTNIMLQYDWPGNVRELQNVLEHACIMRNGNRIDVNSLPQYLQPDESIGTIVRTGGNMNLKDMTAVLEKDLIQQALKKYPNRSMAISELGISRSSFYEKVKKYHIDVGDEPEEN